MELACSIAKGSIVVAQDALQGGDPNRGGFGRAVIEKIANEPKPLGKTGKSRFYIRKRLIEKHIGGRLHRHDMRFIARFFKSQS